MGQRERKQMVNWQVKSRSTEFKNFCPNVINAHGFGSIELSKFGVNIGIGNRNVTDQGINRWKLISSWEDKRTASEN